MAHVNAQDTKVSIKTPDHHALPITFPGGPVAAGDVQLTSPSIQARAHMFLHGKAGEVVTGWKFGCIQLKFVSSDWAYYRGATNADGSCFRALDRPPARPHQLCRDTDPGSSMFYEVETVGPPIAIGRRTLVLGHTILPASGKLEVAVDYEDQPRRFHALSLPNISFTPRKLNYLHEVQLEAAFATIFGANDPAGKFHPLKHFYWNVTAQIVFHRDSAGIFSAMGLPVVHLNVQGQLQDGLPHDRRFSGRATDNTLPVCNTVVNSASDHAVKKYATTWQNFNVGHPVK